MTVSFIGGENRRSQRKLLTCHKSLTNYIKMLCSVHLAWTGFELTTLVVIGIDCIGSYISNYHTITTMTAPIINRLLYSWQYEKILYSLLLKWKSVQDGTPICGISIPLTMPGSEFRVPFCRLFIFCVQWFEERGGC